LFYDPERKLSFLFGKPAIQAHTIIIRFITSAGTPILQSCINQQLIQEIVLMFHSFQKKDPKKTTEKKEGEAKEEKKRPKFL
jgi:hypothetical protein